MKTQKLFTTTNFRNETPYLDEFVSYHLDAGVDHMFLYDQSGKPEDQEILRPYVDAGRVTVVDWTHIDDKYWRKVKPFQANKNHLADTDASQRAKRMGAAWLLKFDVDEFLWSTDPSRSIKQVLDDVVKTRGFYRHRALRIPRYNFGPGEHKTKPEGGVIRNYYMREELPSNYKDCARVDALNRNKYCYASHRWSYKIVPKWTQLICRVKDTDIPLRINHYYTKSEEEFLMRQNISGTRSNTPEGLELIKKRCHVVEDKGLANRMGGCLA